MPPKQFSTLGLLTTFVIFSLWLVIHSFNSDRAHGTRYGYPPSLDTLHTGWESDASSALTPHRRKNVVVASSFAFHFDVYMAVVKTLGDVIDGETGLIHLFAPEFGFGFQDIVDELDLWTHRGRRDDPNNLTQFLNDETGDDGVDLIILGTCEIDMNTWSDQLTEAWERRDTDHKFKIVCIVHNVEDTRWQHHITRWARRDAIRLLPIADHVRKAFREKFAVLADSPEPELYTAGYQHIPIDVHVPILEIPDLPIKPLPRQLSKAVIQGTMNAERRDYHRFFRELIRSLHEDPGSWGYHPLQDRPSFVPNYESPVPPFELLLVGAGSIQIPEELAYIVTIHHDLSYKDFYHLVANTDVVVPAFADFGYFRDQASSTVALATELNVPLLVTSRLRQTYGYIDDVRAVITRPAAMSEVDALKALRTGDASSFFASDPAGVGITMGEMKHVREAVELMLEEGWVRGREEWIAWREDVWKRNREVMDKILKDLS